MMSHSEQKINSPIALLCIFSCLPSFAAVHVLCATNSVVTHLSKSRVATALPEKLTCNERFKSYESSTTATPNVTSVTKGCVPCCQANSTKKKAYTGTK